MGKESPRGSSLQEGLSWFRVLSGILLLRPFRHCAQEESHLLVAKQKGRSLSCVREMFTWLNSRMAHIRYSSHSPVSSPSLILTHLLCVPISTWCWIRHIKETGNETEHVVNTYERNGLQFWPSRTAIAHSIVHTVFYLSLLNMGPFEDTVGYTFFIAITYRLFYEFSSIFNHKHCIFSLSDLHSETALLLQGVQCNELIPEL